MRRYRGSLGSGCGQCLWPQVVRVCSQISPLAASDGGAGQRHRMVHGPWSCTCFSCAPFGWWRPKDVSRFGKQHHRFRHARGSFFDPGMPNTSKNHAAECVAPLRIHDSFWLVNSVIHINLDNGNTWHPTSTWTVLLEANRSPPAEACPLAHSHSHV